MSKHPVASVIVACIYLAVLANYGSATPSRAETEAYDEDETRETTLFDLTTIRQNGKSEETDEYSESVDTSQMDRTYISALEEFLKGILVKMNIIDAATNKIRDAIKNSQIPLIGRIGKKVEGVIGSFGDILNLASPDVKAVFPGTYWCGAGDDAPSDDDLGVFRKTDACCKAHDSCDQSIPAGKYLDNILNNGIFTRSHCSCDSEFYDCLKNASTFISSKIGATYFNILSPQCFKEEYPIIDCIKYEPIWHLHRKCLENEFDYSQERRYQWFDNPRF